MILAVSRWARILKTSLHIKKKKVGPSDPMLEKLGQDPISKYKIALPLERFPRILCLFPPSQQYGFPAWSYEQGSSDPHQEEGRVYYVFPL